jgi:hypothetical protein
MEASARTTWHLMLCHEPDCAHHISSWDTPTYVHRRNTCDMERTHFLHHKLNQSHEVSLSFALRPNAILTSVTKQPEVSVSIKMSTTRRKMALLNTIVHILSRTFQVHGMHIQWHCFFWVPLQGYSSVALNLFFVFVPPDVISLQLCSWCIIQVIHSP